MQTRRARRAYVKHQKAVFLDRLRKHSPEIHAMLRKQKGAHQTPITKDTWEAYLHEHICAPSNSCPPPHRAAAEGSCPESHTGKIKKHNRMAGLWISTPQVQQQVLHTFWMPGNKEAWVAALKAQLLDTGGPGEPSTEECSPSWEQSMG